MRAQRLDAAVALALFGIGLAQVAHDSFHRPVPSVVLVAALSLPLALRRRWSTPPSPGA